MNKLVCTEHWVLWEHAEGHPSDLGVNQDWDKFWEASNCYPSEKENKEKNVAQAKGRTHEKM